MRARNEDSKWTQFKWFKDRARHLHRALGSDVASRERVEAVLEKHDGVGLQNVQHVIAVEAGFDQWKSLLDAPEPERLLVIVMTEESHLNDFGIGLYDGHRGKTAAELQSIFDADRKRLRDSVDDVTWTAQWLKANVVATKTINLRHSSYGLKHIAEKFSPMGYLSNGVFIAGAIVAGYPYRVQQSCNVLFGMSEKSIRAITSRRRSESFPRPRVEAR